MENEINLELKKYINIIKKKILIIILITSISTLGGYISSKRNVKNIYQTSTTLIAVNSGIDNSKSQVNDIINYQSIITVFSGIAASRVVAEKASEILKGKISPNEIQGSIKIREKEKTTMITIIAQGGNPKRIFAILNAVSDAFKEESLNIYPVVKFQTVDKTYLPQTSINQENKHIVILSIFLGLVVSIFTVFLIDYLDVTFKSEEEIEKKLGLPIIGNISKYKI